MGISYQPSSAYSQDEEEERRRREAAAGQGGPGGAQSGAPSQSPQQSPTFAEMQRAGRARPGPSGMHYLPGGVATTGAAPPPPGFQPPGQTPFGQSLQARYQNYRGPGAFQGGTQTQGAPRYAGGPAYQPGGVNMSYSTVAAPGLRETGGFSANRPGFSGDLESLIMQSLGAPSAYDDSVVQGTFNRLSGQIDDDFSQQETALEEDMARRGLADSSIRGGRLSDLNVAKRSARTELADRLVERTAETRSADTARAIAQAMGYDSQSFNQGLAGFQANLGANSQNFQQDLASRAFQGDQNAMEVLRNLDIAGYNRTSGQMGYENQRQAGLDQFGADMDSSRFASSEDQRRFGNDATGYGLNLSAGQQGFNQQQALLDSLLGYQQQGFENSMAGQSFDADNAFRDRALEAQIFNSLLNSGMPGPDGEATGGVNSTGGVNVQHSQAMANALQQMLQMGIPYDEAYRRVYGGQR